MRLAFVFVVHRRDLRVARLDVERQHVLLCMQLYELGAGIACSSFAGFDNLACQTATATRPIM